MDGFDSCLEVDPRIGQVQLDRRAAVQGIDAKDPAQLGQEWIEPGVNGCGVRLVPQGVRQLLAGDPAVTIEDEIGEQEPPLASGEAGLPALTVVFDRERSADLDPQRIGGCRGHAQQFGSTVAAGRGEE